MYDAITGEYLYQAVSLSVGYVCLIAAVSFAAGLLFVIGWNSRRSGGQ